MPLIVGTLKITVIAAVVAVPVGLATAIFLSEYASEKTRKIIKPILEVLAGIPTIGFAGFISFP
jgi:phosphate transport system permease protein